MQATTAPQGRAGIGSPIHRRASLLLLLTWLLLSAAIGAVPTEGNPVNVVPFGEVTRWDPDGKDYGVVWEDARDIHRVVVTFAPAKEVPKPESIHIQYWQSGWPHRRIPREGPSGAGSSGWLDIGDWFQGKWKTADTEISVAGPVYTFTFRPVNASEFKDLGDFAAVYRSTLKLRVVGDAALPPVASIEALTDSEWKPVEFEVEWGGNAEGEQVWDGHLEAFNGIVLSVQPLDSTSGVEVQPGLSWTSKVAGKTEGIRAKVLYAATKGYSSFDATVVTVRAAQETFSFAIADLLEAGHILIPDLGALVRKTAIPAADGTKQAAGEIDAGGPVTYEVARLLWMERKAKDRGRDLYSRVAVAPEQTLPQAWNDTPAKDRHYIPLSFEGGRQHFGVEENGNAYCIKNWISRLKGKDTARCAWDGNHLRYSFGLPDSPARERGLEAGYLPIVSASWERDGISYRQTAFVVPLLGVPAAGGRIWADDTLVLMLRLEMRHEGGPVGDAWLSLGVSDETDADKLVLDGDMVLAPRGDARVLRMLLGSPDPANLRCLRVERDRVLYKRSSGDAKSFVLDVAIPYISLAAAGELAQLRSLRFDDALKHVRGYWQSRIQAGCRIATPEPMINDFYRAHVSHLLINTEREVGVSDRYMAKVGTFNYGVYANESCMMVSDLDRRGYHKRAEQALESWLYYQGTVGLPGDFSSREGQFYGAGGYEHGGYNQHHGWVLWCLGEHYFYSRDDDWLNRVAPNIVQGCEWIIRERQRTIQEAERSPIRAIEKGLLPPGRLEDIGDWRSWLSTNVYSWWGMQNAARALVSAGHSEGQRLADEADAYRQDILAAYTEAMQRSPVVRLRDSSWIPHIPADAHRRGRSFGWITETLEGAIHMVRCGILDPLDRVSTWIVKDFEDNLYLSEQFGYDLKGAEFERYWFSRGGISMQANLLANPIPYLLRDEAKHFLRAYFNAFAVSFFPDTRMMTEHALPNIGDWRGDHYKSSDESNSTYWLRLMLVQEKDDELLTGGAVPRYWLADGQKISIRDAATYFGPMSFVMESAVFRGQIQMELEPPLRNPPARIHARFRHPDGKSMTRCEVNGHPYDNFDAEKEWVELTRFAGPTKITVYYD